MTTTESYVERLREVLFGPDKLTEEPATQGWCPPSRAQLAHGCVICFDQSLAACGMVLLVHHPEVGLQVADARVFKTSTADPTHENQFARGLHVAQQFRSFLSKTHVLQFPNWREWTMVHEAPPLGRGRLYNPEASLLASMAIRIEADYRNIPIAPMVRPQQHKWVVTGNRYARKAEQKPALLRLATALDIEGYHKITNEATRDALSVGITHLVREAETSN